MIAELVLSITFLGKHFCSPQCEALGDLVSTAPGARHEALVLREGKQ